MLLKNIKMSRVVWGVLSLIAAGIGLIITLFLFFEYLSAQSDYEKYCTGLVGALADLGGAGDDCDSLKSYVEILILLTILFGIGSFVALILGIVLVAGGSKPQYVIIQGQNTAPNSNYVVGNQGENVHQVGKPPYGKSKF